MFSNASKPATGKLITCFFIMSTMRKPNWNKETRNAQRDCRLPEIFAKVTDRVLDGFNSEMIEGAGKGNSGHFRCCFSMEFVSVFASR